LNNSSLEVQNVNNEKGERLKEFKDEVSAWCIDFGFDSLSLSLRFPSGIASIKCSSAKPLVKEDWALG
jgi:hypothetical protein